MNSGLQNTIQEEENFHQVMLNDVDYAKFRLSLNCESETRNAKRLKCGKAVRNGPKFLDRFAGPNAGGHTKMRNLKMRNENVFFSPPECKLTDEAR
jgi:hypothetical protein